MAKFDHNFHKSWLSICHGNVNFKLTFHKDILRFYGFSFAVKAGEMFEEAAMYFRIAFPYTYSHDSDEWLKNILKN